MDKNNQKEFYEKICTDTWKELYRFIYYKVQNREEAQDIIQETYTKAFSYLCKNEVTVIEYGSYLRAIAMNIIKDHCSCNRTDDDDSQYKFGGK